MFYQPFIYAFTMQLNYAVVQFISVYSRRKTMGGGGGGGGGGGREGGSKAIGVECHYKYDSEAMFANSVVFLLC